MNPITVMAKRRRQARPVTAADVALVKELSGQILARAEALGMGREEIGKKAGRASSSTLYGWRNGSRQRPSLLDLNDFAAAVGLIVRLLPQDAVNADNTTRDRTHGAGDTLKPETAEVVRLMESWPTDARAALREDAWKKNSEMLSDPQDADAEHAGRRARNK